MSMKDISMKIATSMIVTLFAGVGSVLGSEGAKAGLKALMNRPKPEELPDPVGELIKTDAVDITGMTEAMEAPEPEAEVEVEIPETEVEA